MQIRIEPGEGELQVILQGPRDSEEMLWVLSALQGTVPKLWVWDEDRHTVAVAPEDVVWCEVMEDKVFVYTASAIYRTALGLAELESRWEHQGFFRCGKSAVVNLNAIRQLRSRPGGRIEAELSTGEKLMISRRYAPFLRDRIQ